MKLNNSQENIIANWVQALQLMDLETQGHSNRVTTLISEFGRRLDFSQNDMANLIHGALLHDIGKIKIPDEILQKPGPLTKTEWKVMKRHPLHAHDMLKDTDFLKEAMDIPLYHHERWDGSGYPFGLSRESIPLHSRMFGLVDRWDALTHDRPYRKAWSKQKTILHLKEISGHETDPNLLDIFLDIIIPDNNSFNLSNKFR